MQDQHNSLSVVIPTYRRETILIETISQLLKLQPGASEILVIDQTEEHEAETQRRLEVWNQEHRIRWLRLSEPSIPHAMNTGLIEARNEIVLFLDDDIDPDPELVRAHLHAHLCDKHKAVAGQVLQPGEVPLEDSKGSASFVFRSDAPTSITEFMAGNFSINRSLAINLGGFDENFVRVAYRFESEFAERIVMSGETIYFEPRASIRHLKAPSGGTRVYGNHLTTLGPGHSVGAYYYLFRSRVIKHRLLKALIRPMREVRTRFHLRHPWWILPKMLSEVIAMLWAVVLLFRGPRLLTDTSRTSAI